MPNETGITGNEFFARDSNLMVPSLFNTTNPGMITFDGGAFKGFDEYGILNNGLYDPNFLIPKQKSWDKSANTAGKPQNDLLRPQAVTVFETISAMQQIKNVFDNDKKGDPVVVAYSHYARGAYWLTWQEVAPVGSEASILDNASWSQLDKYLNGTIFDNGKYLTGSTLTGKKRNNVPFSALTVWYLPGLDHQAHFAGMGAYKEYFTTKTDPLISQIVTRLKNLGEFNNKIFIIVADHGHTAMPDSSQMTYTQTKKDEDGNIQSQKKWNGYNDCKLNLEMNKENVKYPEIANNNLHIWELANLFNVFPSPDQTKPFKILVPKEIKGAVKSATTDINEANIIAALNGPMAHIYVKGTDWKSDPDPQQINLVVSLLYSSLENGVTATGRLKELLDKHLQRLTGSIDKILMRRTLSGPYEVVTSVTEDLEGNFAAITTALSSLESADKVKAELRVSGLNNKDRSGDIILIMKDTTTGEAKDRYTTGVACKSWHGSMNPSDSYVPLIVAYPGGSKSTIDAVLTKDGVCKSDYSNCKGNWNVTDIIKGFITEQYK